MEYVDINMTYRKNPCKRRGICMFFAVFEANSGYIRGREMHASLIFFRHDIPTITKTQKKQVIYECSHKENSSQNK